MLWDRNVESTEVSMPSGKKGRFFNCFMINDDDILIAQEAEMTLLNSKLEQLKQVDYRESS